MRLDQEVLDLLRHDPELLAIADAIASTQMLDVDEAPSARSQAADRRRRLMRAWSAKRSDPRLR